MSDDEKHMTAYHEGGHAICSITLPECDPVHKATIIPRGRALGMVMSLPEGDRYSTSKVKLLQQLIMAMGGRAAEEIIFGPDRVSNGASGDIKMATDQTRRMVTEWGMSEKLGMISYGDNGQEVFLGHSVTQNKNVSEATAREIDNEIKAVIDHAYAEAKRILTERRGRPACARQRPAGIRNPLGRRNPHGAPRRKDHPQSGGRAHARPAPRLGPHRLAAPGCAGRPRPPASAGLISLRPTKKERFHRRETALFILDQGMKRSKQSTVTRSTTHRASKDAASFFTPHPARKSDSVTPTK